MRRYEQLLEDYEDAYFALLMDKVAKQEGERLEHLNQELIEDPNFEVPETTDQKCRGKNKNGNCNDDCGIMENVGNTSQSSLPLLTRKASFNRP